MLHNDRGIGRRSRARRAGAAAVALLLALACSAAAQAATTATLVVNTLQDLGYSCAPLQPCSLRGALMYVPDGGTITFDPAVLPGTIVLQAGALQILNKTVSIVGPGADALAIDGGLIDRIFATAGVVTISGVSLINGRAVVIAGGDGAAGTGEAGGSGSLAQGGCISVTGSLTLTGVALRHCTAQGGNGGVGGTGLTNATKSGGKGGAGGSGGNAYGGAIYLNYASTLVLAETSIVDAHAIGGSGGNGGDGGSGVFIGSGGHGGAGGSAMGGAIYAFSPTSVKGRNITVGQSTAVGGKGGNGGSADPDYSLSTGGDGGNGGGARGGLMVDDFALSPPLTPDAVYFAFATFGEGGVTAGLHGSGGRGKIRGGTGTDGTASAAALMVLASSPALSLDKSAVFGAAGVDLCLGPVANYYYPNIVSDSSCGPAYYVAGLATAYRPLDLSQAAPAYVPRFQAIVINSAPCAMLASAAFPNPAVSTDMRATPRPQGNACDIGAIETDYVFVGGFD